MKIAFTTLGCPDWDLKTVCAKAREYGYDGIDFRGLQETLDVTTLPAFTTGVAETRKMIRDAGLEVSGFSTSISICNGDKRKDYLEEAKRTIASASALECKNIRVFGGGDANKNTREEMAKVGRECLHQILALDGARKLNWNLETHDTWISSKNILFLLEGVNDPAVGVLWDFGHTPRMASETPEETFAAIGKLVRYTHIKDAVRDPAERDGWRYVSPGEGELPLERTIKVLKTGGYDGYLTLEHEKRWHKNIAEPDEAFSKYAKWARRVIA